MDKEAGVKLLLSLSEVLTLLDVPFFLMQGTALGAYRDGGFVPDEKDIDLGILIEHFRPTAGKIVQELVDRDIEVETWHRHKPFGFCHTIVAYIEGAKADLVGFHLWGDKRFTCTPNDPINVPQPYAIVHDREILENYQTVKVFGREFRVPSPIEVYLASEYGPDWRIPADDSVSRLRVYDYLPQEGMDETYFSTKS